MRLISDRVLRQLGRPIFAFVILLGLMPLISSHEFYRHILTMVFLFAFISGSWNLISGFGGQFSLGHVAFFGIGSYVTAILYCDKGISPWIGLFMGGICGVILALIIGFVTFRLRAFFFALSTIACAEALHALFTYWRIKAPTGLGTTIPFNEGALNLTFRHELPYTYIAYTFLFIMVIITTIIVNSRTGYYLRAIGGDEEAAMSVGVNPFFTKMFMLSISAFFTAVGGGYYGMYVRYIEPSIVFNIDLSVQFAIIAIVGGMSTVAGPIVGAALLLPLSTFFRSWIGGLYTAVGFFVYGILLVIIILIIPGGMMKGIKNFYSFVFKRPYYDSENIFDLFKRGVRR